VGIGTSSPEKPLHVNCGTGNIGLRVQSSDAKAELEFMDSGTTSTGLSPRVGGISDNLFVQTSGLERMRIDSSGNLLVGTTTTAVSSSTGSVTGTVINNSGLFEAAKTGTVMTLNRLSEDGTILNIRKDGTTVGGIGVVSGNNLNIFSAVALHSGLSFGTGVVYATDNAGDSTNGVTDLGSSSYRWKNIYLSGGVVFSDASGSGTSTANTLEDYEEGYFTGTIADATSGGNTGSTHTGYYTKIGELVTVSINLNNITTSGLTSSNTLHLRGLPFTSASTNFSLGAVRPHGVVFQSDRTSAGCQVGSSDTWMTFYAFGSGLSDTPIDVGDITSGTSDILATVQYRA
jgi:hypothetical protein